MVTRKYVGDVRLENVEDGKGRIRTVPVYRGEKFTLSGRRAVRGRVLLRTLGAWLCYLIPLLLNSPSGRFMPAVLPLLVCAWPLCRLSQCCFDLYNKEETLTRQMKDRLTKTYPACALAGGIFSSVSLIGRILYCVPHGAQAADIAASVVTALLPITFVLLFRARRSLIPDLTK